MAHTLEHCNFVSLKGLKVAILRSAICGIHLYRRFPSEGTMLRLKRVDNSNFENAVMVETLDTWNMQMVGLMM